MARAEDTEVIDLFEEFYRNYYRNEIGDLAQKYPNEKKSLYVDWQKLYRFDPDLADDYRNHPEQFQDYAEEALRLYDLPVDVKLGQAHVRVQNIPETTEIREIRADHRGMLISVQGIVRKATDVRPKVTTAAFECQRCGTLTRIPQAAGDFQEPHECQGCERQGPFRINYDQSEFVDAQKLRVQESPEGLRGGETPQNIDVNVEDDITGEVTAGDHVRVTGVLNLDQRETRGEKSPMFDVYMDGVTVEIEDEQFEDMDITDEDKKEIVALSEQEDIYEQMVDSIAPSIYGYRQAKLAMILQLFSGVTKHLPDESRIRGDLHMLLIGDPGTGKCIRGDTPVTLADGTEQPIRELVESNLDDPKPVDDGVYDHVDFDVPSLRDDGTLGSSRATKVWKREAPERMCRIRTASGTELEVTPSHPLFVPDADGFRAVKAANLSEGDSVATPREISTSGDGGLHSDVASDGGITNVAEGETFYRTDRKDSGAGDIRIRQGPTSDNLRWDPIESIERVEPEYDWVYDLEVAETHNYLSNGIVSHNSAMLQYIRNIAPRSVYTSGKGSSSAGLTAAAVRDDFGDGQQWTLEAGALVLADQGIAAVDELDKMRCVTGDTLVHLGNGRICRIGEVANEASESGQIEQLPRGRTIRDLDIEAWTMTDDGQLVRRPVTAIHEYDAPEELTRVTLQSGERLTATEDHPFFVLEGGERLEKPAGELEPDDWVYVPRQLSEPAADGGVATASEPAVRNSKISTSLAAVLGYLSGDGNVYYDRSEGVYGIRFTNADEELLADFERACRDAFDTQPVRPASEQREDGVETVRVPGKEYADAVLDAGMNLETYDGKRLPDAVSTAGRAAKAAFVRALADSEGTVDRRNVKLHSASYELLLGTKHLLLEFGISSQIQTRERDDRRNLYVLVITDAESLAAFDRYVGFTLDRKQRALDDVIEAASGDRTVLDVVPDIGTTLREKRESLRLYQSECGLADATYCNFENGDANISFRAARTVLEAFRERKRQAQTDRADIENADWAQLSELRERYHVSQRQLADSTAYSQQQVSRLWGTDEPLRERVRERLSAFVTAVAETDLSGLQSLVYRDVKWRKVQSIETVSSTKANEDQIALQKQRLADLLGCDTGTAEPRARQLLSAEPATDTWDDIDSTLDTYGISYQDIAHDVGVAGSTVSRWFNGLVETDRFDDVRTVTEERVADIRDDAAELLDTIEANREAKVYDLTVEGTHNFVANGMVVHNSEDRSAMHEALEQQSYHPNSEVLLADGRRVNIGEFVDERMADRSDEVVDGVDCEILPVDDVGVHSVDLDANEVEKTAVDRVSRHEAPDEFVRVTFSNGRDVLVTPEHPMFVDDGGEVGTVEASSIEEGTFVPAPRKLPNSAEPVELDPESQQGKEKDVDLPDDLSPDLAEFLGLMTAEGHSDAGSAHEIGFSNQDEPLLARAADLMHDVFGMASTDATNAAGTVTKRWVSTKLFRWFEENFPEVMHTARDKRIPAAVLGASEEEIRRFLVGAFAGDGGVESEAMSFSTASAGLARDYADALSKIGVASRIHHDSAEDSWKVYVMGDSTEQFVDRVVESTDDRYDDARAFVERSEETPRHHDVLPTSAAREIRELRSLLGLRLTGKVRPNLDEGFGVQSGTVEDELDTLRERADEVRDSLTDAETLADVRGAVGWSGRELGERIGEMTSTIHYAEDGGYDAERRSELTDAARTAVEDTLTEFERRADALERRCDLRYYRVTDVETVPNEGEYACDWVYDVTVEPTNTFVSEGVVLHNSISVSKAGINATLKSRCSLLGAANPKYGRFDQYESIAEQIDLEPALISRFDLIFTVTDKPDEEEDRNLAEHILTTNYAGELNTHRTETSASDYTEEEVERVTEDVAPTIEPELLRKYVAYAKRNVYPTMTEEAKSAIREFYVDLRSRGTGEDAPVPVTARKLEALVRLAEASARIRLSDTVEREDAERVIEIVRSCLEAIGLDPETGELDADVIETGTSKTQRDRIKNLKTLIAEIEDEYDEGAPVDRVLERAEEAGMERSKAEHEIDKLKQKGEVYEPQHDHLRTT
ncbi:LAGLIDADG family homing endonuclease [Halorientalis litorea]|uniref:LAGLIDADG family homing endonuclease n=1 Tax=Halorientalis litorea TaxID=2931977 RepID=UPI001FF26253|nr:LAGLIDADG family homing endonuclease [Halorientalis litorea]